MSDEAEEACKKFLRLSTSKEPGDVITGLNLFSKQASLIEFLEQYVKISRDCSELNTVLQWDKQQRTHNGVLVCFRCMEQVCLKSANTDASDNLKIAGHNLAINLINNHMKIFYSALSPSVPNVLSATALRLLTAMVAQGPSVAQELLHSFNFSYKPLEILPTKVGNISKTLGSIRLCFIQFAVSFLVVGTNDVIQEVLSLKGFLNMVFTLLPNDSTEIVYLVLNTLQEKVIGNPNISKRVKSAFFTHSILTKISLLFSRKEEIELDERVMLLSDYCRDFILKLCTDFQLGICYKSKGIPSSWKRSNNPTLLQFLLSLKDANEENSHQQQIVLATLKACPDLVISYLNGLSYAFEPKLSSKWISNVEYIIQVYSSITELPQVLQQVTHEHLLSCVDTAVAFTAPPCVSRNVLSQGVQNSSPLVKSTMMSLLLMILRRSSDVIQWYSDTVGNNETADDDFLMCYCDGVLKFLPDVKTIISLRQLLSNKDKLNVPANAKNDLLHKKHQTRNTELADGVLLREQILEVLCGYQRLSHDILSASGFDLTKLLPSVTTSDDLPENLLLVLTLLLGAPMGTLKWHHPKNNLLSSLMHIMYLGSSTIAIVASRVVKKMINVLPVCHSIEVDIIVTSLLSQLQCRIYSTDDVSLLIMTLVDGLKCLAKVPLQFMEDDSFKNDSTTSLNQAVSLESILASDLELPMVNTEVVPHSNSNDCVAVPSSVISPLWLMLISQCTTEVLLLPLVTEVILKLLLITDHPASMADAIIHRLGDAAVAREFMKGSTKWIYHDFMCHVLPWKSIRCKDFCFLNECSHEDDDIQKPMKYIKKALQSDVNAETDLFKYLSLFSSVKLTSLFSDVWKLCNKEWHDNRGSIFLQQYLHIRPLQVTGVCFLSPLTLLLQCLPKEPVEVECKSYQVSKAKRKKMEVSLAHPDNIASIQLIKLTTEKLSAISQTISTSVCKKMLMVVRSLLKNITSLNSQIEDKEMVSLLQQYYDVLRIIVEKILSNNCTVSGDNLLVKCDQEECSCSLVISTVFNNSSLQENFLTQSTITNTRLLQKLLVRKRKHMSQTEAACSSLVCDLIRTCLKVQPKLIKVSCIRFYFDKIIKILGAQDLSFITESSAHKIFQQLALYMESETISIILDKLLANMISAIDCDQHTEKSAIEILNSLQLENHINYFILSHSGFISLLSICNSCKVDELDKLLLDILLAYVNRLESKLSHSKDGKVLTNVLEEICQNVPSLSKLFNHQTEAKFDLLEAISTDVIMDWITNPNACRISMVGLVIKYSKRHCQHFATTGIGCLSDNISEANVHLYLPLFETLTINQECIMPKYLAKMLWNYCSNQLTTSATNQELCSHVLIKLVELQVPGVKKMNKLFAKLEDVMSSHSQWNDHQLAVVGKLSLLVTDDNAVDTLLVYCMKQMSNFLTSACNTDYNEELLLTTMLSMLKTDVEKLTFDDLVLKKWNNFVKLILKHRLRSTMALNMLHCFIKQLYSNNSDSLISIGDIYEMIWSHSQFLDIMLCSNEADDLVKEGLVQLLLTTFDPNRCTKYHYAVLLAAYHPTMEITNQHIIQLMQLYEINGVDTSEFSPYLWGKTAVDQFKERQKKGWVLCKQPGMAEVLDMLDKKMVKQSTCNFPIDVSLEPSEVHDHFYNIEVKGLYDPRYLLPLFSHLLNTGNLINCRKFISHGCAGYLVAALSSHNTDIRAAAYHCLSRFYIHLEGSRFREKHQIVLLMDVLRNSIAVENSRISCIHSLFLCRCLEIFLTPDHDMYLVLANFMVYKPALDLQEVSMFYLLVHSSSNKHKLERLWIMSLLKEGLRSECDYGVYRKRNVIPILMTHYNSLLTDASMKLQILLLIKQASLLHVVTTDLVWNKGLLAWLHFVADSTIDGNKLSLICEIIHNIWNTIGKVFLSEEQKDSLDTDHLVDLKQKVHVPHIEHDMALLLLCLQQKLNHTVANHH